MVTFATLILMRKLDLEKSVYNLRTLWVEARGEGPPRIPGTPDNKENRVHTGRWRGWEMAWLGDGYYEKVHRHGGTCGSSWFSLWEMDSAFMYIYLELILVILLHNTECQQVRKILRMGLELDVLSTQGIDICVHMYIGTCIEIVYVCVWTCIHKIPYPWSICLKILQWTTEVKDNIQLYITVRPIYTFQW